MEADVVGQEPAYCNNKRVIDFLIERVILKHSFRVYKEIRDCVQTLNIALLALNINMVFTVTQRFCA